MGKGRGRTMYVPEGFVSLLNDYRKDTNTNSVAFMRIVENAKLGREVNFIAKQNLPSFLKARKGRRLHGDGLFL
jgi:hypothetical protein